MRKEKKREKKEKRKERKDSEKGKLNRESEKLSKEKFSWGGGCDEETERLEKSGLTDEHDDPVCRQNLCYLSDGTHSSNKRKRDTPPSSGITTNSEFFHSFVMLEFVYIILIEILSSSF